MTNNTRILKNYGAVILAGGKSRRMDADKKMLRIGSETLLEKKIFELKDLFGTILISVGKNSNFKFDNIPVINDIYEDKGPVSGVYTALKKSRYKINFICAVDIPGTDTGLICKMADFTNSYEVVVPVNHKGKYEPLFAFYSTDVINRIETLLESGSNKIIELYKMVKKKEIILDEGYTIDNLNTKKDYIRYMKRRALTENE